MLSQIIFVYTNNICVDSHVNVYSKQRLNILAILHFCSCEIFSFWSV